MLFHFASVRKSNIILLTVNALYTSPMTRMTNERESRRWCACVAVVNILLSKLWSSDNELRCPILSPNIVSALSLSSHSRLAIFPLCERMGRRLAIIWIRKKYSISWMPPPPQQLVRILIVNWIWYSTPSSLNLLLIILNNPCPLPLSTHPSIPTYFTSMEGEIGRPRWLPLKCCLISVEVFRTFYLAR